MALVYMGVAYAALCSCDLYQHRALTVADRLGLVVSDTQTGSVDLVCDEPSNLSLCLFIYSTATLEDPWSTW